MTVRRLLSRVLLVLVVLMLITPVALLALLGSDAGSAWLLRQGAAFARSQQVQLAVDAVDGNLLDRLELTGLDVDAAGTRVAAGRLLLHWRPAALLEGRLHVLTLEVSDLRVAPATSEEPHADDPPALPDISLPLVVQVDRLLLERVTIAAGGDAGFHLDRVALSATLDAGKLVVDALDTALPGANLTGSLTVATFAPHALQGELAAQLEPSLTGAAIGRVAASAQLAGQVLQPRIDLVLSAPVQMAVQATLALDRPQPGLALNARWDQLAWPLRGDPAYTASDGRIELHGTLDDYRVALRSGLAAEGLPGGDVELDAQGDLERLRLAPLRLNTLDGELRIDGPVAWRDGVDWDLGVTLDGINPGRFLADWPGKLAGTLQVGGRLEAGDGAQPRIEVQVQTLNGELRGYPVSASGEIALLGSAVDARDLKITSGGNRVALDGHVGERIELGFQIDAPQLVSLYPGLAGRLQGSGRVAGSLDSPQVVANLDGGDLAFEGVRVQGIDLDLDWQPAGGTGRVRLAGVATAGVAFDSIDAEIAGAPQDHRLTMTAAGEVLDVRLDAAGGVCGDAWVGRLTELVLQRAEVGEWRLAQPTDLALAAQSVRAGRLCLAQQHTTLCASGGWSAADGLDAEGTLADLDLGRLAALLPGDAVIDGELDGDFRVQGAPQRPNASLVLRPTDGRLRLPGDGQPLEIAYRNARFEARFEDDEGSATMNLDLGTNGAASGRLRLGRDRDGQRALDGRIDADFPDLALVAGFVPAVRDVEGRLHIESGLGGTLQAPRVTGTLEIIDAQAQVVEAGITLTDVGLAVRGEGAGPLRVQGQVRSGDGRISISGTVEPGAAGGAAVDLRVEGTQFQAVRLPEATVEVAPDLRLTGQGPYHLGGTLRIPKARIEIKELPKGAVAVSDDEIVVGAGTDRGRAAAPRNLTAKVRVEPGDQVRFKGFGLQTGLSGALDASVNTAGTHLDGKIELVDGSYKAYGQDLKVERGRLLFAGPPGNPDVDMRAVRVSRDGQVKAYLEVRGNLSKPRTRVYSEPTLPDAEALAYLLTGRGLDQAGRQEGIDIAGAALSLGIAKGEPLLQNLSDRLGLDELRVESGENGIEESSLIVGKYLNPDLYLGYSQNLFNPEGAVLMRLRLSDRVEVETRSGSEQSVDLFYRYEHD